MASLKLNSQVKKVYLSNLFVKILLGSLLITFIGCFLPWMKKVDDFFSMLVVLSGIDLDKFILGIKTATFGIGVFSLLWLLSGLILNERNIRFVGISFIVMTLLFSYTAYYIYDRNAEDVKLAIAVFVYGLLYLIPTFILFKDNFKGLMLNISLSTLFLFLLLLYLIITFNDDAMQALGFTLQYGIYVTMVVEFTAFVTSMFLTIKLKKHTHKTEVTEESIYLTEDKTI